jgi:hypothetical protein
MRIFSDETPLPPPLPQSPPSLLPPTTRSVRLCYLLSLKGIDGAM